MKKKKKTNIEMKILINLLDLGIHVELLSTSNCAYAINVVAVFVDETVRKVFSAIRRDLDSKEHDTIYFFVVVVVVVFLHLLEL